MLVLFGSDEFKYERAAQIILLGIALEVSSDSAYALVRAPFIFLLLFGAVFEILYLIHQKKHKVAFQAWTHIERQRMQKNYERILRDDKI
jgi:hypothetical protein